MKQLINKYLFLSIASGYFLFTLFSCDPVRSTTKQAKEINDLSELFILENGSQAGNIDSVVFKKPVLVSTDTTTETGFILDASTFDTDYVYKNNFITQRFHDTVVKFIKDFTFEKTANKTISEQKGIIDSIRNEVIRYRNLLIISIGLLLLFFLALIVLIKKL